MLELYDAVYGYLDLLDATKARISRKGAAGELTPVQWAGPAAGAATALIGWWRRFRFG